MVLFYKVTEVSLNIIQRVRHDLATEQEEYFLFFLFYKDLLSLYFNSSFIFAIYGIPIMCQLTQLGSSSPSFGPHNAL